MTIDFNTGGYRELMRQLVEVSGKSMRYWLVESGKRLLNVLISSTPPFVKMGGEAKAKGGTKADFKVGLKALKRDVTSLFFPFIKKTFIAQNHGVLMRDKKFARWRKYFFRYASQENANAMRKMLKDAGVNNIRIVNEPIRSIHQAGLDKYGHAKKGHGQFVLRKKTIKAYIADASKSIGKAKAGWSRARSGIGMKTPLADWISKHLRGQGRYSQSLMGPQIYIEMGNSTKGAGTLEPDKMLRDALRVVESGAQKTLAILINKDIASKLSGKTFRKR